MSNESPETPQQPAEPGDSTPHDERVQRSGFASFDGRRWAVLAVALVLLGFIAVGSVQSYRDLSATRSRIVELEQEISATQERIESLEMRNESLQKDPVLLEFVAREELGLVRPGEIVLALDEALR